ncbi:urea ABC transporter, ATP-binding protein UrtE [Serratia fonticola]|uniref:Urea ABC transporter, ATP-binding protein UrtE n=1 Tax=Serratia fonticola TaxID=47917 RepID=A0A4U9W073_SERFO|nr:urea ABC transporter, ATP-binding protein UrtE [Serratia fonticola]
MHPVAWPQWSGQNHADQLHHGTPAIVSGSMTWQLADEPPQNLLPQPVENRALLGIGYVPQGRQIFSQLSVEENLQVALLAGRDKVRRMPPIIYNLFPGCRRCVCAVRVTCAKVSNSSWH